MTTKLRSQSIVPYFNSAPEADCNNENVENLTVSASTKSLSKPQILHLNGGVSSFAVFKLRRMRNLFASIKH